MGVNPFFKTDLRYNLRSGGGLEDDGKLPVQESQVSALFLSRLSPPCALVFLPFLDTRFCAVADEGNDYIYVMGGYYNKYKAYQYKVRDLVNRESVIQI